MILKQLIFWMTVMTSIVSFSQDSLWIEFEKFENRIEKLPIDTTKHCPTKFENFELVWVKNVAHSHAEITKGNRQLYQQISVLVNENEQSFNPIFQPYGYFRGEDYFVIEHHYNITMSTIFNDTYYYKRKNITGIRELFGTGNCHYLEHTGPSPTLVNTDLVNTEIDSLSLLKFKVYSDSYLGRMSKSKINPNAYYKLKYYYAYSRGFDLYSGNHNYECLYDGNDIVLTYKNIENLIRFSGNSWMFPHWTNINDSIISFSGVRSEHGGTFDIESQKIYYFEIVQ